MRLSSLLQVVLFALAIQGTSAIAADAKFDWKTRFPSDLIDASGKKVDASTLNGKVVGFYFSAHWCGPCRLFTPELVKFAKLNKDKFAVVFISSDRPDEKAMFDYMKETKMPWAALPYQSEAGIKISQENDVKQIPTLLIYDSSGNLVTKNGRDLAGVKKILNSK
jgi:nucleoredoxin